MPHDLCQSMERNGLCHPIAEPVAQIMRTHSGKVCDARIFFHDISQGAFCAQHTNFWPGRGQRGQLRRSLRSETGSTFTILQSIDVNSAAACSEFEARVWPVTYFIAAKFIVYSATAGPCIQAKCRVIRQSEVNLATSGLELVAAERV